MLRSTFIIALLAGMFFNPRAATAQITVNLALNARPQPFLANWGNAINGVMIINYMAGPIADNPAVKIKTTLLAEAGGIIAVSNISAARVYTLRPGVNQFSMADALQLQNLTFNGSAGALLRSTGRIAPGQYQLMVEVTNTAGDVVRARQTRPFFIVSYQMPLLMSPANGAALDARVAQSVIIFRWTPVAPALQQGLPAYIIQVFEVLPGQTPMQAFRGNRPILNEQAIKGSTQHIWRPNLAMLDSTANRRFIWTVQTLDADGAPIPTADMNIQGRSEPATFSIVTPSAAVVKKDTKEATKP